MKEGWPRIVERFPQMRDLILEVRARDDAIDELCFDYDVIVDSLRGLDFGEEGVPPSPSRRSLERLKDELERELLERLLASRLEETDG